MIYYITKESFEGRKVRQQVKQCMSSIDSSFGGQSGSIITQSANKNSGVAQNRTSQPQLNCGNLITFMVGQRVQ